MADWKPGNDGEVGENAVEGGSDVNGETIYVGRVHHGGDHIPGKIVPSHHRIYYPYGGKELSSTTYEFMVPPKYGFIEWHSCEEGHVPSGAVVAGETSGEEPLFVGRAFYHGSWVIGKVHPSHHCLYIPFDGVEVGIKNYEVLTIQHG